jgi:hypothetical protein
MESAISEINSSCNETGMKRKTYENHVSETINKRANKKNSHSSFTYRMADNLPVIFSSCMPG